MRHHLVELYGRVLEMGSRKHSPKLLWLHNLRDAIPPVKANNCRLEETEHNNPHPRRLALLEAEA